MNQDIPGYRVVRADHFSGLIVMLIGVFALSESWHLPFGSIGAPDAGFFPRLLSVLLLLFGAGITLNAVISSTEPVEFHRQTWYVVIAAVSFVIYAFSVQYVGYVICTLVILVLLMRGLCRMTWLRSLVVAVPSVLLSYWAFSKLGVPLPTGILPF
jgi:putative tricarboxylic transport membrane protein